MSLAIGYAIWADTFNLRDKILKKLKIYNNLMNSSIDNPA